MSKIYAHIGYPKCGSTALQVGFFSKHPHLYDLGPRGGGHPAEYLTNELRELFEIEIRLKNDINYNKSKAKSIIESHWEEFNKSEKKAFSISSEAFTIKMGHEADITQKAARLYDLLGENCYIILFIRNQKDIFKSLYKEFLNSGCFLNYNQFMHALWEDQAQSVLMYFDYYKVINLLSRFFGREKIVVYLYEDLIANPNYILSNLSILLGVNNSIKELPKINLKPDNSYLEWLRKFNYLIKTGFGKHLLSSFNLSRSPEYLSNLGHEYVKLYKCENRNKNIKKKLSKKISYITPSYFRINWNVDINLDKKIHSYFAQSNQKLSELLDINLSQYGYYI